ncbi:uncharacterized protein LOC116294986 [Actinia tenebrosa]|uniref:Uncharacterized protein LOC116294986 n=1 Tax=Actinia tenebrosa TaxID=6105 RepID=A0A6P8HTI4_ACTTE|nr:uncharacterized protein LOC116294986 [Actinia tenebrosa]
MLFAIVILLSGFVHSSMCCPPELDGYCHDWVKLNTAPVCFMTKDNKPGSFTPTSHGFLTAVKLVHLSGYVTCDSRTHQNDNNWGCKDRASVKDAPLNTFVTDKNNKVMFPLTGVFYNEQYAKTSKYYGIQEYDPMSPDIVLQHGLNSPSDYVGPDSQLRVWYGEDLFNTNEGDNGGKACVDVFGYFV